MKIKLIRFRCFDEKEIEIPDENLCLLSGKSGKGKSTILEAIKWCLYGSESKINHVYPHGKNSKAKNPTQVIISTSTFTISRSRPPECLEVIAGEEVLTDASAQNFINSYYGNCKSYDIASYLSQGNFNPLLSLTNSEKMLTLEEMVFGDDDSSNEFLKKYKNAEKRYQKELDEVNQKYQLNSTYREDIEKQLSVCDFSEEEISSEIDTDELETKITKIREEITYIFKLEKEIEFLNRKIADLPGVTQSRDFSVIEKEIESISHELRTHQQYRKELDNLRLLLTDKEKNLRHISFSKDFLEKALVYFEKKKELSRLSQTTPSTEALKIYEENKVKDLEEYHSSFCDFSGKFINFCSSDFPKVRKYILLEDIPEVKYKNIGNLEKQKEDLREYENYMTKKKLHSLNVEDFENHNTNIKLQNERVKKKSLLEELREIEEKIQVLENQIKELRNSYSQFNYDFLPPLEQLKIETLDNFAEDPLKCPHCNREVILKSNTLVLCEKFLTKKDKMKLAEIVRNFQKLSDTLSKQISKKSNILVPDVEGEPLTEFEFQKVKKFINDLSPYQHLFNVSMNINQVKTEIKECEEYIAFLENQKEKQQLKDYLKMSLEDCRDLLRIEKNFEKNRKKYLTHSRFDFKYTEEESARLLQEIKDIPGHLKYKLLEKEIDELYSDEFSNFDSQKIHKLISEWEYQNKLSSEITELKKKINLIPPLCDKSLEEKLTFLEKEFKESKLFQEYQKLTCDLEKIKRDLGNKNSESLINQEKELSETLKRQYYLKPIREKVIKLRKLDKENKKLEKRIKKYSRYISTAQELYDYTISLRSAMMEDYVGNINFFTNKVLKCIYDEDICIDLKLYRENKTNDKVKAVVNFEIYHKGNVYDSHKYLSGGEKDRLSLALTLAFSSLSSSKFLILDECMSSLDDSTRELCTKTIKRFLPHKTIINVCHSVIEAHHNTVIEI